MMYIEASGEAGTVWLTMLLAIYSNSFLKRKEQKKSCCWHPQLKTNRMALSTSCSQGTTLRKIRKNKLFTLSWILFKET